MELVLTRIAKRYGYTIGRLSLRTEGTEKTEDTELTKKTENKEDSVASVPSVPSVRICDALPQFGIMNLKTA